MKKAVLLFVVILFCSRIYAQNHPDLDKAFSLGFELGAPSHDAYNIGLGGTGKFEFPISSPVSISITAGYSSFIYKGNLFDSGIRPDAAGFVPLKAGVKYYLAQGFYAEGELGTAIETNYAKQDLFAFSIGPGFFIPFRDSKNGIDFGFRYEGWANEVHQTAIRFAYRFGL